MTKKTKKIIETTVIETISPAEEIVVKKNKEVKKIKKKPVEIVKKVEILEVKKEEEVKSQIDLICFYGHNIRSTYTKNQWYFCLEDILKIANVVDPNKFLINLKNQTDLKDNYYQFVESFSYYENENPIIIPIVNYQSFNQLLLYIREVGSTIPGPFPDWLKNMANRSF